MSSHSSSAPAPDDRFAIVLPDGRQVEAQAGQTIRDLLQAHGQPIPPSTMAAYLDNYIVRLDFPIERSGQLRLVSHATLDGGMIYERSLICMLHRAVHEVFPGVTLTVNHSLDNQLFCEMLLNCRGKRELVPPSEADLARLEARMREYVAADEPFEAREISVEEARQTLRAQGNADKADLLAYRQSKTLHLYRFGTFWAHYYGYLAPSARSVDRFALFPHETGLLLAMPKVSAMDRPLAKRDSPKLYAQYQEYEQWCGRLGVPHVAALNSVVEAGKIHELVLTMEALHEKRFARTADAILARNPLPRVICAAGPSSSGKTTFAKRLRIQLRVNGIDCVPIGLDDYFVDRERTPRDEKGEFDFESFDAIDVPRIGADVAGLIAGQEVMMPKFDFKEGRGKPHKALKLEDNQVLLLEGLHGLNPRLLPTVMDALKFKIYISPLTALNIDETTRVRSSDIRILRRIVRDHQFRGYSAGDTLSRRRSLRAGEEKHIFPYQEEADLMMNTSLLYELGVVKGMAEPLLREISPDSPVYSEARRLLNFLGYFLPIPIDYVPTTSILREFIGHSVFAY
jgi:uridine kinase